MQIVFFFSCIFLAVCYLYIMKTKAAFLLSLLNDFSILRDRPNVLVSVREGFRKLPTLNGYRNEKRANKKKSRGGR